MLQNDIEQANTCCAEANACSDAANTCCNFFAQCFYCVVALIGLIIFLSGGSPRLRLSSVSLDTLKHTNSSSNNGSFILVFNAEFAVKNKNLVETKLKSTKATILYSGAEIGSVPINGLTVGKRSTEKFNMTVFVDSDKILLNNGTDQLRREMVSSKNLTLVAFAKFKTEVNWILKKTAKMNCTFVVDTVTRKVIPLKCK